MREEKEQCKQELQKALECPKARKKEREPTKESTTYNIKEDRWGCKYHWTLSSFLQDRMLRDMHVNFMMGPSM
jgi:hypothetical protein